MRSKESRLRGRGPCLAVSMAMLNIYITARVKKALSTRQGRSVPHRLYITIKHEMLRIVKAAGICFPMQTYSLRVQRIGHVILIKLKPSTAGGPRKPYETRVFCRSVFPVCDMEGSLITLRGPAASPVPGITAAWKYRKTEFGVFQEAHWGLAHPSECRSTLMPSVP